MNLYLVKRDHNNTRPGELCGILVYAESFGEARKLAAVNAGDEGPGLWFDPGLSRVELLGAMDVDMPQPGVILRDFWEAG